MKNPQKILILMLILLAVILASRYLASLRVKTIAGEAAQQDELRPIYDARLLAWLLPKKAKEIKYQITPFNRYYEASFRIGKDDFQLWIDDIQGGEIEIEDISAGEVLPEKKRLELIEIPLPDGIDFHMRFLDYGMIHLTEGLWLPQSTTSKFHQFSAAFDAKNKMAYVYFYR